MKLPATGTPRDELDEELRTQRERDVDFQHGKIWTLV